MSFRSPRVDVALPTRGGRPDLLREAVESILAQSLDAWRLVVGDSGEDPDDARRTLEPFLADPRVELVRVDADLSLQRKQTLLVERGDAPYVGVLHDDDRWAPRFLERRVTFLEAHPECGFAFGPHRVIDVDGSVTGIRRHSLPEGVLDRREYVRGLIHLSGKPAPPSGLIRRSTFEEVGLFFDERFPGFDQELWIRLAVHAPVGYLDEPDSDFRVHEAQLTYKERWGENRVVFFDHVESLLARELPDLQRTGRLRGRSRARAWFSAAADAIDDGERRVAFRRTLRGFAEHPAAVVDPRAAALLASVAVPPLGDLLVGRGRRALRRTDYLSGIQQAPHQAEERSAAARAWGVLYRALRRR